MKTEAEGGTPIFQPATGTIPEDVSGITAILAHDLKSPISIIISTLDVLITFYEGSDEKENSLRLLQGALSAAHRQMNLVSDLVDLIRLKSNCYDFEYQTVNAVTVIEESLAAEAMALTAKRLRIEQDLPENKVLIINTDEALLRRMIMALIDNVIKFTVHDDKLCISAKEDGEQLVVEFTDSGRPIFSGYEQRILEAPPRWEDRQLGTRTSVAMGLPFIYEAAKAQNGSFTGKTDPVTNLTTFTLRLPITQKKNPPKQT